jgi:hypothetical protein
VFPVKDLSGLGVASSHAQLHHVDLGVVLKGPLGGHGQLRLPRSRRRHNGDKRCGVGGLSCTNVLQGLQTFDPAA